MVRQCFNRTPITQIILICSFKVHMNYLLIGFGVVLVLGIILLAAFEFSFSTKDTDGRPPGCTKITQDHYLDERVGTLEAVIEYAENLGITVKKLCYTGDGPMQTTGDSPDMDSAWWYEMPSGDINTCVASVPELAPCPSTMVCGDTEGDTKGDLDSQLDQIQNALLQDGVNSDCPA